jgi:hypothetical protein
VPRRGTGGRGGGGEDGWGAVPHQGPVAREPATAGVGGDAAAAWMRGWMRGAEARVGRTRPRAPGARALAGAQSSPCPAALASGVVSVAVARAS